MGQDSSSLLGRVKPCVPPALVGWDTSKLHAMKAKHLLDLDGSFALTKEQFVILLDLKKTVFQALSKSTFLKQATALFSVYDTAHNGRVDAYEVMASICMLSNTCSMQEKIDFLHSLYDFQGRGNLLFDELILLLRTVAVSCNKVSQEKFLKHGGDKGDMGDYKEMALLAFMTFGKKPEAHDELTKWELDQFLRQESCIQEFWDYFSAAIYETSMPTSTSEGCEGGGGFCDVDFPPGWTSLYQGYGPVPPGMPFPSQISWLRPKDFLGNDAKLFPAEKEGRSSNHNAFLVQGQLPRNAYFLDALGLLQRRDLAFLKGLFLSTNQEHVGRYCIQFWRHGNRLPVIVDDRVPCNESHRPIFSRGSNANEYWVMLVEKAYAKFRGGCYESLCRRQASRSQEMLMALQDLTGHPAEQSNINHEEGLWRSNDGWNWLKEWIAQGGVVGMRATNASRCMEERQGIVLGDMYSIEGVYEERGQRLIKVKNVLGRGKLKRKGPPTWEIAPSLEEDLKMSSLPSYIFFLDYTELISLFDCFVVCWLKTPLVGSRKGRWVESGGGCFIHSTWYQNQQYFITLKKPGTLMLNLSQPEHEGEDSSVSEAEGEYASLGLAVIKHDYAEAAVKARLYTANVRQVSRIALRAMTPFSRTRDIVLRCRLPKGKYVVTPQTYHPATTGQYCLSFYFDEPKHIVIHQGGKYKEENEEATSSQTASAASSAALKNQPIESISPSSSSSSKDKIDDDDMGHALILFAENVSQLWMMARALETKRQEFYKKIASSSSSSRLD